jgi:hypothetical protein
MRCGLSGFVGGGCLPRGVRARNVRALVGAGLLAALVGLSPAWAETGGKAAASRAAPAKAHPVETEGAVPAPAGAEASAVVHGFRSAHFGMTEDQVRATIAKDFGLKGEAVKEETNLAQQTHALTVLVPDLLEGGGRALVAYVFGYKTKTLIQVGITWSKQTDETITPEKLFSNGNILQAHFLASGYQPQSVATNGVIANGVLLFRGADAQGRTTALLLLGTFKDGEKNQKILTPDALSLLYVADPKNPDIFKLPEGKF